MIRKRLQPNSHCKRSLYISPTPSALRLTPQLQPKVQPVSQRAEIQTHCAAEKAELVQHTGWGFTTSARFCVPQDGADGVTLPCP